ncbi:MAG: DUF4162 domain-containing protein, partial [Solirubrobacterales bacterium]|nr:DUF4162 domain-containing protein [Solirubrobacterales bacterium]
SSLDPAGRVDVLQLIAALAPATTVLLSSHDLSEIEAICEHVGILTEGRLLYQGPLSDLLAGAARSRWSVVIRAPATPAIQALQAAPWVSSATEQAPGELELTAPDPAEVEKHLAAVLAASGSRVVSIAPLRPSLEDVFLSLTSTPTQQQDGTG